MQTNREEKRKDKKGMFMKLFKYIIGVNSEATEIDMTTPVTTKRIKVGIICLHLWHGSVAAWPIKTSRSQATTLPRQRRNQMISFLDAW